MTKSLETMTIPSPIDVHVHLREPGQEWKETIATGTRAALRGGYQFVADMPNNAKPIYTLDLLQEKQGIMAHSSNVHVGAYQGQNILDPDFDEIRRMMPYSIGSKFYMGPTTGNIHELTLEHARPVVDTIITEAQRLGIHHPILLHVREEAGFEMAEYVASQGHPVHWCHVSTESEARYVADLSKRFPEFFTAGVTPHHLTMTQRNANFQQGWNGARMMPPLAREVDAEALLYHYNNGDIQILETDHAPHAHHEKMRAEEENPEGKTDKDCTTCFGVSGIEFVLPIMTALVKRRKITMERLVDSLYDQPMRMLGLRALEMTSKTTLLLGSYVISESDIVGKSRNTPYVGWTAGAKVITSDMMSQQPRVFGAQPKVA